MADINVGDLGKKILEAIAGVLKTHWQSVKDYASMEAKKLAQTLVKVTEMVVAGRITKQDAEGIVAMQANASKAVLLAVAGIGLIAAQQAIQAGLDVVSAAVNKAIGFALL